ncbi:hypothetical protein N8V39_15290 [Enterobacter hormaechei subsp. steigerwaltii]|nr:hypothetical protein [Enterobacter hormaechei subsp. steigerwaltii]MCU2297990.1 hypothetical protein [Enterobacter hormaechei subsp. steigerwaltii]MCU2323361.1 hypothetical protein [Enterobacter hormaechei subsp. steigerwaltii]MCU2338955.1 hypothetical protein [Enterobacter hormaechei subsp. steigerwaltii]MCU2342812.1 hypothetical protein [Enterobacter hormaechei subsp. steigerwaltii]
MKMKQNRLCLLAVCTLLLSHKSGAVSFDPSLLAGASGESDLSRFSENNAMPAGSQEMDIYVNPRFYVSTSKSIIKALINMHSFEIQLSPIG